MQKINDKLFNWASDIEPDTILQAERTARLPIVEGHVALMPDAHLGIGATVGSVIPTKGAIIPAAVGVDIGCVDADSEFLSPDGWKRIADYNGELVMQYNPEDGVGTFVKPSRFVKREQDTFLHLHTKYGVDQALTRDHKVLCWNVVGRDRHHEQDVVSAADFAYRHRSLIQGNKAVFETSFLPSLDTRLDIIGPDLRVMVMVMADGHIDGSACSLHLKKDRKILRAKELLTDAGIDFTINQSALDQTTTIRFQPPLFHKSYDWCWGASVDQLSLIVDEVFNWDGNADDRCFYTRDEASADFMQYAFTATGHRGVKRGDEHKDGATDWRVYSHNNTRVSMGGVPRTDIDEIPSIDGFAYCFTVDSGFWVMRRGANIVMTGNCGMLASETDLTATDLPDDLGKFLTTIESIVPAGMGESHHYAGKPAEKWFRNNQPRSNLDQAQERTTLKQFGTLGSGNHFVEVCLDERDVVWVVLHSGSRGIGNKLAQAHIKKAKKVCKDLKLTLEDPDLAYFVQGTPEFEHYIADMLWAQDYAMANRQQMIDNLIPAFLKFVGKGKVVTTINCHHNFTQQETHTVGDSDAELWITRKGAIQADVGDLGIIPGSMGTKSYIVEGLGNPLSWNSCSHGAGRRMSRSAAKKKFTVDDLAEQMEGKTWLASKAASLLDEIPSSYKDIDAVMADQTDLVTVLHELHQVLNFKGA
jgi:RNA-splicing ligase RtcB